MKEEKKLKIYQAIMLILLTAFVTFMITAFSMYTYFNNKDITLSADQNTSQSNFDLKSYLKKVRNVINKYYLWNDGIDEEQLERGAVEGYVAALGDEYTEYIPADEMQEYTENITGNFVGIGIYMIADETSGRVVVYYPIPESPAEKAGIQAGDIIISVDGKYF